MKLSILISGVVFAGCASAAACPFQLMKRAGLLNPEIAARFEGIEKDPKIAENLLRTYSGEHIGSKRSPNTLIGPRSADGTLDLPLGGGLCKSSLSSWPHQGLI